MAADFNQTENLLIIGSASNDYSFVEIGRRSWVTIFSVGVLLVDVLSASTLFRCHLVSRRFMSAFCQ